MNGLLCRPDGHDLDAFTGVRAAFLMSGICSLFFGISMVFYERPAGVGMGKDFDFLNMSGKVAGWGRE
jgi:hypothetical protein